MQSIRSNYLPPRYLAVIVHVIGLSSFTASFLWLPNISNPLHNGFGGSYQFLTIIALTLSTITFAIGLLANFCVSKRLLALKVTLSMCATPLDVLISTLYWTLHSIDKKLVVPPGHELPFIPDLGFHAVPAIMLVLDFVFLSPSWMITGREALAISSGLFLSYWVWLEYCYSFNKWWSTPSYISRVFASLTAI